jgi:pimeloyl-ACP methyl ester carboxylesterase
MTQDSMAGMQPIALRNGFGLMHRGATARGVGMVLCSPWGIHEIAARKVLFQMAARLADAGVPVIRFDYPGTADAIGIGAERMATWVDAATDAADALKLRCGIESIVFGGIGLGATVALLAAAAKEDCCGLALLAPVVSGRRYLREIALGAPVVEEGLGIRADQRPTGVSIGGIVMPEGVAEDLGAVNLLTAPIGRPVRALVVARPSQPQEVELGDRLEAAGWTVGRATFDGFEAALDNPTLAVMPDSVVEAVVQWGSSFATDSRPASFLAEGVRRVIVQRGGHCEEPVLFANGLFGVRTHPDDRAATPTVVFLNSGYDHHAGWAYQWARMAASLAADGIASLRFDTSNVGDSVSRSGAPEQVMYSVTQQEDVRAALDFLEAEGESRGVILVGRCSTAFTGFHCAAADPRIRDAILINPQRIIWDDEEDVEIAIRIGPRPLADYRRRAISGRTFKRLLAGDIDVIGAARGVGGHLLRSLAVRAAPLLGPLSKANRFRHACHRMMSNVSSRGAGLHFVCTSYDTSLEQMAYYFGPDHKGLARHPGAQLSIIADADHNVTPQAAHDHVLDIVLRTALSRADSRSATSEGPVSTLPSGGRRAEPVRA